MPLFSLLQMGASSSRTTPLKCIFLKNWDKFDPQNLKRHAWSSSVILNGHSILWNMGNTDWLKGLNYNTVLQLDQFCRKQEKWVEVPYMLLFISLWDMPDLCFKGADLGVKSSAPSCSLTLLLYSGLPTEQAENQGTLSGGVASISVKIHTVPIVVNTIKRIQKVHRRLYRTNFTLWAYLERYNVCLGTDTDSWLKNLSFGGGYYLQRWMVWVWDKGKEQTRTSPSSFWEPNSSHNTATLLDVFL